MISERLSRLPLTSTRNVERWAWAAVAANTVIILTGGLVRLTGSGLGCPTWPKCTDESFTPHRELGVHGVIEFGNRMLTYVLVAVVIGLYVAVRRWPHATREQKRLALVIVLGVPFQAVIGGISVLTDLNPWVVSLHLVLSMALVATSVLLVLRLRGGTAVGVTRRQVQTVVWTYVLVWVVVYLGTVVTGSGPHAGDDQAPRNDLNPQVMSHVHAVSVYLLVAATVLAVIALRDTTARTAAVVLLVVELAQGTIGFVQYFTDLPIALVATHLVGAAVLVASATWLLVTVVSTRSPAGDSSVRQQGQPSRSR